MQHLQHINSVETFQKKYKVKELVFNSHAGLFESYLCEAKSTTILHDKSATGFSSSHQHEKVYLQALRIKQEEIWDLSAKITKLKTLDANRCSMGMAMGFAL